MAKYFKIVEEYTVDYVADDGRRCMSERLAQSHNAELAMKDILGPNILCKHGNYSTIRSLIDHAPLADVEKVQKLLRTYLDEILPSFMSMADDLAANPNRFIETLDGTRFRDCHIAAQHCLEILIGSQLWDDVSQTMQRAVTGTGPSIEKRSDFYRNNCNKERFVLCLINLVKLRTGSGHCIVGTEEKLLRALQTLVEKRSTPVSGVSRRAA